MDRLITIKNLTKGDTHRFEIHVGENITDWEIRAELFDDSGASVKVANADAGGSISQITMDDLTSGIFTIIIPKDQTTCFLNKGRLEIEIVDANDEKYTILNGLHTVVELKYQEITRETP